MTVAELIELLKGFPQGHRVAYRCYSEQCLIGPEDIILETHCKPRPDGWVQNNRPDKETEEYVVLPGN